MGLRTAWLYLQVDASVLQAPWCRPGLRIRVSPTLPQLTLPILSTMCLPTLASHETRMCPAHGPVLAFLVRAPWLAFGSFARPAAGPLSVRVYSTLLPAHLRLPWPGPGRWGWGSALEGRI